MSTPSLALATGRVELAVARTSATGPVGVVMTMGALHEGHGALLRAARAQAATVYVTVFVNPLQFGPTEDLARYPRTLDADLALCREHGADLVFAPGPGEIYPDGPPAIRVDAGPLGDVLEGATRPGHYAGVLTVVLKLLQLTRPDLVYFGEKDYQQQLLVRAMVRDLNVPVQVVTVPTVREPDGLARSSRNRYLSPVERERAAALPAALRAGQTAATGGAGPAGILTAASAALTGVRLDYLAITDPQLRPLAPPRGDRPAGEIVPVPADRVARLLVAGWVGETRLIDNTEIRLSRGDS